MTKIQKGDYIVPSNDGSQLWRLTQIQEEEDGKKILVWSAHRFSLSVKEMNDRYGDDLPEDFLDWDQWEYVSGWHRSRELALEDIFGKQPEPFKGPELKTHADGSMSIRLW
jgi:hypothetical protein